MSSAIRKFRVNGTDLVGIIKIILNLNEIILFYFDTIFKFEKRHSMLDDIDYLNVKFCSISKLIGIQ